MNNEANPSVRTHTTGVANFLGPLPHFFPFCWVGISLLQRQMILMQDKSHWRTSFCAFLFLSVKPKKNCFPPFRFRRGRFLIKKDTLCVLRYKWYSAERGINASFTEGERKMILACRISGRPSAIVPGDWTELPSFLVTWLMEWPDPNNAVWHGDAGTTVFFNCSSFVSHGNVRHDSRPNYLKTTLSIWGTQ
jgi:hypothetical protein